MNLGQLQETSNPRNNFNEDILFTKCDWLRCIVKLQRQVLMLTSICNSHDKCESILKRMGGKYVAFACCHGQKFHPSVSSKPTMTMGKECSCKAHIGNSVNHCKNLASKMKSIEAFLETIKLSYRNFESSSLLKKRFGLIVKEFANGDDVLLTFNPESLDNGSIVAAATTFHCPVCVETIPTDNAFAENNFKHTLCIDCTKSLLAVQGNKNENIVECPICRRTLMLDSYVRGFLMRLNDLLEEEQKESLPSRGESTKPEK